MKLWAIVPELLLGSACLVLVPLAAFSRGAWRRVPLWAAMAATLAAIVTTTQMLPWATLSVFDGTYIVDHQATVFKLVTLTAALVALGLFGDHFRDNEIIPHAPAAVLFATTGAVGLSSSADLGLIVLFFEMMSLATYVLTAIDRRSHLGHEAALKLFIFGATTLAIMAYGLSFVYGLTGSLDLAEIGRVLPRSDSLWIAIALMLALVGYGFEITLVPFHVWSPDAFTGAAAPIGGFLSVVPKVAAFAALLRLAASVPVDAVRWDLALAVGAALTMTVGNVVALRQTTLKRLLAYSSIAQAGYVLGAVAASHGTVVAIPAVAFYLLVYALMNLAAFLIVAAIERAHGSDGYTTLNGLGGTSAAAGACLLIALLSLAGIPPLAGFAGKILLLQAMMQGGMTWLAVIAIVNMVIGLYYYAVLAGRVYFESPVSQEPLSLNACGVSTMVVASLATIALGVWPSAGMQWISMVP